MPGPAPSPAHRPSAPDRRQPPAPGRPKGGSWGREFDVRQADPAWSWPGVQVFNHALPSSAAARSRAARSCLPTPMRRLSRRCAATLALWCGIGALHAQTGTTAAPPALPSEAAQAVTVTGTRERALVVETPASVGVISGRDLRFTGPMHPQQLLGQIPGVAVAVTNGEGHSTAIRQPFAGPTPSPGGPVVRLPGSGGGAALFGGPVVAGHHPLCGFPPTW